MNLAVFDLDGTLVDSFEDIARAANHALTRLGHEPLPTPVIQRAVGHGLGNLIRRFLPDADTGTVADAVAAVREYYQKHPADCSTTYPGIPEALDRLGEIGVRRVVLSNKIDDIVQSIAKILGLSERTDEVWGHRDGYPLKPDPASLRTILRRYGCTPEDCVVVGDAGPDADLARNAGTHFCAVTWGMTPRDCWELRPGEWIVDTPEELIPLFGWRGSIDNLPGRPCVS
jgi:phosphoglycolate phosphatase